MKSIARQEVSNRAGSELEAGLAVSSEYPALVPAAYLKCNRYKVDSLLSITSLFPGNRVRPSCH